MLYTYGSDVAEKLAEVADHAIDILPRFDEAVILAVGDGTNHIKGVELKPFGEIADRILGGEKGIRLVEKFLNDFVDGWFILHKC